MDFVNVGEGVEEGRLIKLKNQNKLLLHLRQSSRLKEKAPEERELRLDSFYQ